MVIIWSIVLVARWSRFSQVAAHAIDLRLWIALTAFAVRMAVCSETAMAKMGIKVNNSSKWNVNEDQRYSSPSK